MKKIKDLPEFPKYANEYSYSDVEPYEIVRVISSKTLEIRPMNSERIQVDLKFIVGGFAGHCINQDDQKWNITSNPNAPTIRIRLTKRGWTRHHYKYHLSDTPIKFYDYNF